jgi:two-component system chemotaxis response regulator CheB
MPDSSSAGLGDPPRPDATGTRFTCPDCGGVLFQQTEGGLTRFRCSVGHVFSIESLADGQGQQLEGALWTAVRALEDRAELLRQLAGRARSAGSHRSGASFAHRADDAEHRAALVRDAIERSRVAAHASGKAEAAS